MQTLVWHQFSSVSDESACSELIDAIENNIYSKASDATQSVQLPKRRLYNHPTEKVTKLEIISEEGDFWENKFGNGLEVPWSQFQTAFQTEFAAKITELYKSKPDQDWLFGQLKDVLGATDTVTKARFLKVMGESEHSRDHIWKVTSDIATENYCMKEVFNMKSAVRLPAVENLGENY